MWRLRDVLGFPPDFGVSGYPPDGKVDVELVRLLASSCASRKARLGFGVGVL